MELWVRSQDKGSLVKVDNLYVSIGNYICYYVEKGKEVPNTYYRPSGELGRYATKERALEVLDEIQKYITPTLSLLDDTLNGKQVCQVGNILSMVYEMPKD